MAEYKTQVEQYRLFEINLTGTTEGNPYQDVTLSADFTNAETGQIVVVGGFYRGHGNYSVRFMASSAGRWAFTTRSTDPALDGQTGVFTVTPATQGNHGRVLTATEALSGKAREAYGSELKYRFTYEDGTPYQPYGTTCYAWVSQPTDVQDRTVATLAKAPFNKIRMCVFPKFYDFNTADPWAYAYPGTRETGFDHTCFDEEFFANLDCPA